MNFFLSDDLAPAAESLLGRKIDNTMQVGLRPEHLLVSDRENAVVEGRLDLVENLGEVALVHLRTASNVEFIAKTEEPPEVSKGSVISFGIKNHSAHYFDAKTGMRLT